MPAGDKALESGSVGTVLQLLADQVHRGIEARYHEVVARSNFKADDVAAGRVSRFAWYRADPATMKTAPDIPPDRRAPLAWPHREDTHA